MKHRCAVILFILGFAQSAFAQYAHRNSNGLNLYAQGGLNLGVEYDISTMKINDYIISDSQETQNAQLRYGSTFKLFLNKVGLFVGYAITKTGGVNKVSMTGSKFNLGLNFCLDESHHKSPQVGCYFNWGTRNYYFKNSQFLPSTSMNPNLISNEVNLIQFNQRSIGAMVSVPVLSDEKSSSRFAIAFEYNLNSTYWNMGQTRIPEYGKSNFVVNTMLQIDFGYSRSNRR
jgi:hypothetical protein